VVNVFPTKTRISAQLWGYYFSPLRSLITECVIAFTGREIKSFYLSLFAFYFLLFTFYYFKYLTLCQIITYEKQTPQFSSIQAIWRTIGAISRAFRE